MASFKELQVVLYGLSSVSHHFHWITNWPTGHWSRLWCHTEGVCFRDFCPDDFREIAGSPIVIDGKNASFLASWKRSDIPDPKVCEPRRWDMTVPSSLEGILCVFFFWWCFWDVKTLPMISVQQLDSEIYMFEILRENSARSTALWHNLEKTTTNAWTIWRQNRTVNVNAM